MEYEIKKYNIITISCGLVFIGYLDAPCQDIGPLTGMIRESFRYPSTWGLHREGFIKIISVLTLLSNCARRSFFRHFYMEGVQHIPNNLPGEGGYYPAVGFSSVDPVLIFSAIR